MTTTDLSPSALRNWLTGCLLAILAFGVCWTGAVIHWYAREGDPGTGELLFYLFLLPAVLAVAALVTRQRLAGPGRDADQRAAGAPLAAGAATTRPPADAARSSGLAILATALRSPYGASLDQLADAVAGRRARPQRDATLVDPDGLPLPTARCASADALSLQDEIGTWLAADALPDRFAQEDRRALILGTEVTRELAVQALTLLAHGGAAPLLQLALVLPAHWRAGQRHAAGRWLQQVLAQAGWPDSTIALPEPADPAAATGAGPVPTALFKQLARDAAAAPVTCLLIAFASHLGEESIAAWAVRHLLFTSRRPQGLTPGEGAIGMLLVDSARAGHCAVLGPVHSARRDSAAANSRTPASPLPGELAGLTGLTQAAQAAAVAMIVADTGTRPGRMLELMGFAARAAPQLDNQRDIVTYGYASGACGAVPALTALALAGHHVGARGAPVLWVSNEDPFQCCVAMLEVAPESALAIGPAGPN